MTFFHVTRAENLSDIMRGGLVPSIGARSQAAKERHPAVFLFSSSDAMEDALMNWLGEEFGEDVELAILQVDLPISWNKHLHTDPAVGFETLCYERIGPEHIQYLYKT